MCGFWVSHLTKVVVELQNNAKKRDTDDQRSGMAAVEEITLPYTLIWKMMIEREV